VRLVTQAIQKTIDQRRDKRRQLAGGGDEAAEGGDGGEGQRMSSLLQIAKTHFDYLARGKQLLRRYKRENRVQVAEAVSRTAWESQRSWTPRAIRSA
jgi:hypothetical protein